MDGFLTEGTLFPSTVEVWKSKLPLFLSVFAQVLWCNHFFIFCQPYQQFGSGSLTSFGSMVLLILCNFLHVQSSLWIALYTKRLHYVPNNVPFSAPLVCSSFIHPMYVFAPYCAFSAPPHSMFFCPPSCAFLHPPPCVFLCPNWNFHSYPWAICRQNHFTVSKVLFNLKGFPPTSNQTCCGSWSWRISSFLFE